MSPAARDLGNLRNRRFCQISKIIAEQNRGNPKESEEISKIFRISAAGEEVYFSICAVCALVFTLPMASTMVPCSSMT